MSLNSKPGLKQVTSELLRGLRELSSSAFPKRCTNCGKVYPTAQDFISETQNMHGHSGLKASLDDNDDTIVDLFRNCSCGSTLMDSFQDRRQTQNVQRREVFERLLEVLGAEGLDRPLARQLLLDSLQGKPHALLVNLGISLQM